MLHCGRNTIGNNGHRTRGMVEAEQAKEKPFDTVGFIMDFEGGDLEQDEIIKGFQQLIDTGLVWKLQGNLQRKACMLLALGVCTA